MTPDVSIQPVVVEARPSAPPAPPAPPVWDPRLTPAERVGLTFVGRRHEDGSAIVYEYREGRCLGPLEPSPLAKRKSPTGFEWGHAGSGAMALAHTILWHVMRRHPNFGADDPEILYFRMALHWIALLPWTGFKITQASAEMWAVDKLGRSDRKVYGTVETPNE